ncbi:ankyrin repeat domain-containing protein 2-like, partial [Trifolium pratense]
MASNSQKDIPADDKSGSAENKTVKDETSTKPTPGPAAGFAGANPFDFSAMSGLLNDPSIKKLAEQIAEDPSFNQMADKPEFLLSIMQQAMKIPNFKTMAKRLCIALLQDPSMSSMLQHFTNLPNPPNKEEIMEHINKDPSLKDIFDVIETGGPAAMMRYWNDEEVLKNLGLAMGINPNTGEAAASSDNPLGLDPPLS